MKALFLEHDAGNLSWYSWPQSINQADNHRRLKVVEQRGTAAPRKLVLRRHKSPYDIGRGGADSIIEHHRQQRVPAGEGGTWLMWQWRTFESPVGIRRRLVDHRGLITTTGGPVLGAYCHSVATSHTGRRLHTAMYALRHFLGICSSGASYSQLMRL